MSNGVHPDHRSHTPQELRSWGNLYWRTAHAVSTKSTTVRPQLARRFAGRAQAYWELARTKEKQTNAKRY